MGAIPKQVAGYVHKENTEYLCIDCPMWMQDNLCYLHAADVLVTAIHTCNYWTDGPPVHLAPIGALTPLESGLARRQNGASCKRCEYWDMTTWNCSKIDKDSPGDDAGVIHPDACCNHQEPDSIRGKMTKPALAAYGVYAGTGG